MRRSLLIILSVLMLFLSSCAIKKVALRYLGVQHAIPTKAWSANAFQQQAADAMHVFCQAVGSTGSALDELLLYAAADTPQLKAPVFFLLAGFLLAWIARSLLPGFHRSLPAISFLQRPAVPIYLRLEQLLYYA